MDISDSVDPIGLWLIDFNNISTRLVLIYA